MSDSDVIGCLSSNMSSNSQQTSVNSFGCKIDDLPDEVLEYILSLVPPYKDLEECSLVCKRWFQSAKHVMYHTRKVLLRAISNFNIEWENITPADMAPSITRRYSHSACRFKNSMYVFGGCTSTSTTFNDLWRLDLNKRQWVRPLTIGTYPSPKACASLVIYNDCLVLFGGWTHPSPYPLHQSWRLFNELNVYGIYSNMWTSINAPIKPPSMAGHSASVQDKKMVIFGGLQKTIVLPGHYGSSNDVWVFDFELLTWHQQKIEGRKPHARYGQSHIRLDDSHILIIGGCGGPNLVYSDVWLLTLTDREWEWKELQVRNPHWGAQHIWCHPACRVGDCVVVFSRDPSSGAPALPYTAHWNTPSHLRNAPAANVWVPPRDDEFPNQGAAQRRAAEQVPERNFDRDPNVNGQRGSLARNPPQPLPGAAGPAGPAADPVPAPAEEVRHVFKPLAPERIAAMAAFHDPPPLRNAARNRQRQLESLHRMEERIKSLNQGAAPPRKPPPRQDARSPKNPMTLFTLDISTALSEGFVQWLPYKEDKRGGPEETILYSLVAGKGEVIMFGGIQKDATSITAHSQESCMAETVSNSLHFISASRGII